MITQKNYPIIFLIPLSADVEYTPHDTVVTSESWNSGHSENYENILTVRAWNFLQNGIQNFVIRCIHSWKIALQKSKIQYFWKKKYQKKALKALKGLKAQKQQRCPRPANRISALK